ncbi:MAG: YjbQ family protein [Deltaproteobacteria bacterium]|nr:YjbQ family protein [Deltaproteobacteria bacterium]
MVRSFDFEVQTSGRGFHRLDPHLQRFVSSSEVSEGLANVFIKHTSCSLLLNENADPDVRVDLEAWFSRLVQDGDALFRHIDEGSDDMSAHIRSVLTTTSMTIPIQDGKLALGIWQGLYLWEHRTRPHERNLLVTILS